MSTRIVCNPRRPASPLRVPTAQVTATTNMVVDNQSAISDTTTVEDSAPRGPSSAPIPIPKSAHMNYRARINRMEGMLAERRLRALHARINTTNDAAAAANHRPNNPNTNHNHPNIRAALSNLTPLTQIRATTNQTTTTNSNNGTTISTKAPQFKRPALIYAATPIRPVLNPTTATAPTTYTPPTTGPRPTKTWNGYTPIVYGGGRCVAWALAPIEPTPKVEPTPMQLMLEVLAKAHDAAAPSFRAERKMIERMVVKDKKHGFWAEVKKTERRDSGFGRSEEGDERCTCSEQAEFGAGQVRCGRRC